jgi:hypothetical protein
MQEISRNDLPKDQKNEPRQLGFPVEIHPFRISFRLEFVQAMAAISVYQNGVEQSGDL